MDFAAELKKLLDEEDNPPTDPLAELAQAQAVLLEGIHKTCSDISKKVSDFSLQVEEVYDIVKDADENEREVRSAAKRELQLIGSLIAMSDMLDDILFFFDFRDISNTEAISSKRDDILNTCSLESYESQGRRLDPRLHTVAAAEFSDEPFETVTHVLESGYIYRGNVIRKAKVIISKGRENT